jgi:branched-chain amino acid transport system permease protein
MGVTLFLVNGLTTGGIYALLAVGFSLIFGVARITNFAHTALYMLAAYVMYSVSTILGCFIGIGAISGILAAVGVAMVYYILVINRVKTQSLAVMILTLALAMLIQEILLIVFQANLRGVESYFKGFVEILGVRILLQHIFTIFIAIVTLFGVLALLSFTRLGRAIRAVSQDSEMANAMGINVGRILLITIGISSFLAGIAAIVVVPLYPIEPYMWLNPMLIIVAAVVLGGLGSITGSIIGALIMGFAEVAVVQFIPEGTFLRGVISLLVMVIVLLFKPEGLFGVVFEEERL